MYLKKWFFPFLRDPFQLFADNFKIALRMSTYGADGRCFSTYMDVSAVTALPDHDSVFFKHFSFFKIFKKRKITFLMLLLDSTDTGKTGGDVIKAFFFGDAIWALSIVGIIAAVIVTIVDKEPAFFKTEEFYKIKFTESTIAKSSSFAVPTAVKTWQKNKK